MRKFKGGAEIRVTREDLQVMLEHVLKDRILGFMIDEHVVTDISVHPNNKYILHLTIKPAIEK